MYILSEFWGFPERLPCIYHKKSHIFYLFKMAACSNSDDKVSVLEIHLEDPGYILWVQAGTCMGFIKIFLEQLAAEVSASLHKTVMRNLHVCVQKQNNPAKMKMCNHSDISFKRALNKWTISCCTNCQCYVDQLVKLTEPPFKFRQSNWDNSNIPLWPTDPWEKAKVYMNYGQTISQRSPQDTDLSGILNFIDNCSLSQCWWKIEHKLKRKKKTAKVNVIFSHRTMHINQCWISNSKSLSIVVKPLHD